MAVATATRRVEVGPHRRSLDPDPWRGRPGAFLSAVRTACLGGIIDPALRPAATADAGQNTVDNAQGGFFVPSNLAGFVAAVGATDDPSAGRMLDIPMQSPIVKVAARVDKNHTASVSGGIVVYRTLEGDTIADSRMKFEQITLHALQTTGLSFATMELTQDSYPSFAAILEAGYRDAFQEQHLEEKLRGTGVGEYGGVLGSPALITVAKESGQAAGSVVAKNFLKMRARCWGYQRAVWIVHPELFEQVVTASAAIGTGGSIVPIWSPGDDETPDRILGRPAFFTTAASVPGELGDVALIDWSQVLRGVWRPMEGMTSIHARFSAFENAFRFTERSDAHPWWTAALTPKRATETISPYVTLAPRS